MHIDLDQWRMTDALEFVNLTSLDDQNVTGAGLKVLPVDRPETAAFPDELHFIVWMTMRSGATSGKCREQEYGDAYVSMVGSDELV